MPTGYRTIGEIGRGGFCVVHKCEDVWSDDVVAVKSLIDPLGVDAEVVARFQREARLMDDVLNHPNIVDVIDRNLSGASPYFVMEKADGSLADEIKAGKWQDADWVVEVFRQVAEGIAYAHEKGVIHRDLKPQNVLVFGDRVRVSDFGLGKHLIEGTVGLTKTNQWSGTEPYMAPEQFVAMKETGMPADVFALGKLLMELLTGDVPDVGQPDVSIIPEQFRYFVSRCCNRKAENRYANGGEALEAFNRILSPASTETPTERLASLVEKWFQTPEDDDIEVLKEIDEHLRTNSADERMYSARVPRLPEDIIDQYMDELATEFELMLGVYDDHVSGGLPFDYCDVVANFYERIFNRTSDPKVKELVIRRLFEMGPTHNRWYVRSRLLSILAANRDAATIAIAEKVFSEGELSYRAWLNEIAAYYDVPTSIRMLLAE